METIDTIDKIKKVGQKFKGIVQIDSYSIRKTGKGLRYIKIFLRDMSIKSISKIATVVWNPQNDFISKLNKNSVLYIEGIIGNFKGENQLKLSVFELKVPRAHFVNNVLYEDVNFQQSSEIVYYEKARIQKLNNFIMDSRRKMGDEYLLKLGLEHIEINGINVPIIPRYIEAIDLEKRHPINNNQISSKELVNLNINLNERIIISNKIYNENNDSIEKSGKKMGKINPKFYETTINRVERDQHLVKCLKKIYNDTCQICGKKVELDIGQYYSEVHHIQPLSIHRGPDIESNLIVLCPNHHTMFDYGAITIDLTNKKVLHINKYNSINNKELIIRHSIDKKYVDYHNKYIYKGNTNEDIIINGKDYVNYGDLVVFTFDGYEEEVQLEDYYNRNLMNIKQRILFGKKLGEQFTYNGYTYKVIKLKKQNNNRQM